MSKLPLKLMRALRKLEHPSSIRVTETSGENVNGRYVVADMPERSIRGVVLAMETERLEFLSAGDASAAGINIMTTSELYYTDHKEGATENRQSFVHYRGQKFRVVGSGYTLGNTDYNSYDCLLYMDLTDGS